MTTRKQLESLHEVWLRAPSNIDRAGQTRNYYTNETFLQFRRRARFAFGDCLMVEWQGMWLGIETDGYCHS